MNFAKTVTAILLTLCCMTLCSLCAAAESNISVDGDISRREWGGSFQKVFIDTSDESNCNINFAKISVVPAEEDNSIFFALECSQKNECQWSNRLYGIKMKINGGSSICVFGNPEKNSCDAEKYFIESSFTVNPDRKEFSAEIRIGIKHGVNPSLSAEIQVYDGFGEPSNVYYIFSEAESSSTTEITTGKTEKSTSTSAKDTSKTSVTAALTTSSKKIETTHKLYTTVKYCPATLYTREKASQTHLNSSRTNETEITRKTKAVKTKASASVSETTSKTSETYVMSLADSQISEKSTEESTEQSTIYVIGSSNDENIRRQTEKKRLIGACSASAVLTVAAVFASKATLSKVKTKKAAVKSAAFKDNEV